MQCDCNMNVVCLLYDRDMIVITEVADWGAEAHQDLEGWKKLGGDNHPYGVESNMRFLPLHVLLVSLSI